MYDPEHAARWGGRFRTARLELGLTVRQAAAMCEVDKATIVRWEAGEVLPHQRKRDELREMWQRPLVQALLVTKSVIRRRRGRPTPDVAEARLITIAGIEDALRGDLSKLPAVIDTIERFGAIRADAGGDDAASERQQVLSLLYGTIGEVTHA